MPVSSNHFEAAAGVPVRETVPRDIDFFPSVNSPRPSILGSAYSETMVKWYGAINSVLPETFADNIHDEDSFKRIVGKAPVRYKPGLPRSVWEHEKSIYDYNTAAEELEAAGHSNTFSEIAAGFIAGTIDPVTISSLITGNMFTAVMGRAMVGAKGASSILSAMAHARPSFTRGMASGVLGAAAELPLDEYLTELSGQRDFTYVDGMMQVGLSGVLGGLIDGAVRLKMDRQIRQINANAAEMAEEAMDQGLDLSVTQADQELRHADQNRNRQAGEGVETKDRVGEDFVTAAGPSGVTTKLSDDVDLSFIDANVPTLRGQPLKFANKLSHALYEVAKGNLDVEDELISQLINTRMINADTPGVRATIHKAASRIYQSVEGMIPTSAKDGSIDTFDIGGGYADQLEGLSRTHTITRNKQKIKLTFESPYLRALYQLIDRPNAELTKSVKNWLTARSGKNQQTIAAQAKKLARMVDSQAEAGVKDIHVTKAALGDATGNVTTRSNPVDVNTPDPVSMISKMFVEREDLNFNDIAGEMPDVELEATAGLSSAAHVQGNHADAQIQQFYDAMDELGISKEDAEFIRQTDRTIIESFEKVVNCFRG